MRIAPFSAVNASSIHTELQNQYPCSFSTAPLSACSGCECAIPVSFVDKTLWPEYQELRAALDDYLNDATERIIREEVYRDAGEASERAG